MRNSDAGCHLVGGLSRQGPNMGKNFKLHTHVNYFCSICIVPGVSIQCISPGGLAGRNKSHVGYTKYDGKGKTRSNLRRH